MTAGTIPFWLDEPYDARPPLRGEVDTDVCVIGAGTCGLSCALRLAQHGIGVVVLERGTVASGASGRNGGFLLAGVAPFHNDARKSFGAERARAMYVRTYAAQEDVYALALDLGVDDAVRRVGMLRVAVSEEEAQHVREYARALADDGFPAEVVERDALPAALRRGALVGCLTEHDGALHPARWYRALGGAAEAAGARIFENTSVQAPVEAPGDGPVLTDAGSVRARHVVVAADGSLPVLVPEYEGRVRPRRLHMVATEPVEPIFETLVYARWGYEYLQQRPDGRILAGGFSDVDGDDSYTDSDAGSPDIWERTRRYLADEVGVGAAITHRWAGVVGYSADSLPYVGEVPGRDGLYVSGGYSGVGNVPGFMCGRDIADTIAGEGPEPLFPAGPVSELLERERARLAERTRASERLFRRAERALAAGVASSYQRLDPWPVYMERGEGARVWDVDGNEYLDFHNGFSAMVQGHAHPAITAAVARRQPLGTHFGAPTEEAVEVAEELARRFGIERWRFTNSGTESVMDAIRVARGLTGRDEVVKVSGSYHGHADTTMVAVGPEPGSWGAGIPAATVAQVHTVDFNDAAAMARVLEQVRPACVVMEAVMTNAGVVPPEPGYLEAVREAADAAGAVLIFDEVKTGLTIAAGGATERFGIRPDMVTLAKALGGGLPTGAIGMTTELAALVEDGRVHQVGTYNGNPLGMAAARANLLEVLTPGAYEHLERLGGRMAAGCDEVIERHGLSAHTVALGSKGCVVHSEERVLDYPSYARLLDRELSELTWVWLMNRGIFTTPGRGQEWNVTVAHDEAAADRYVATFDELAATLT